MLAQVHSELSGLQEDKQRLEAEGEAKAEEVDNLRRLLKRARDEVTFTSTAQANKEQMVSSLQAQLDELTEQQRAVSRQVLDRDQQLELAASNEKSLADFWRAREQELLALGQ